MVVYDDRTDTALAFDREVDGRLLSFELLDLAAGDVLLRDRETGSTWSGLSGEAIEGPLDGTQLVQQPSFYAFWFAWSDFYVNTGLYEAAGG